MAMDTKDMKGNSLTGKGRAFRNAGDVFNLIDGMKNGGIDFKDGLVGKGIADREI